MTNRFSLSASIEKSRSAIGVTKSEAAHIFDDDSEVIKATRALKITFSEHGFLKRRL